MIHLQQVRTPAQEADYQEWLERLPRWEEGELFPNTKPTRRTELSSVTAIISEKIRNDEMFKVHRTELVTFLSVGDQAAIRRKLKDPATDEDLRAELLARLGRHVKYRG